MKTLIFVFLITLAVVYCQPRSGPCVMGTHPTSDRLNCTDKGYFELTQCHSKYCVCVDPKTGHEADGTRTFSNRVLPRCGHCFTTLARMLSRGQTNDLPLCDTDYGNYQLKQCKGSSCTCVDAETGAVKKRGGQDLNCEQPNLLHTPLSFSVDTTPVDKDHESLPLASALCGYKKDRGHTCSANSSQVMFYYDTTVFQCLAFRHNGCGGNGNRFKTISECWNTCIFQDFGGCAQMKKPLKDRNGDTVFCRTRRNDNESRACPAGYKCTHLPFFSICCEQQNEDMFSKNMAPTCQNNRSLVTFSTSGIRTINLLGKSCSDDFCPRDSDCKQLDILAHCCKKH